MIKFSSYRYKADNGKREFLALLAALLSAIIFCGMALSLELRLVPYCAILILIILGLVILLARRIEYNVEINKNIFILIALLSFLLVWDALSWILFGRNGYKIIYSTLCILFILSLYSIFSVINVRSYLNMTFGISAALGIIFFTLYILGVKLLSSDNFYAALMLPLALIYIFSKRLNKYTISYIALCFYISYLTEARTVSIAIIISFVMLFITKKKYHKKIIFRIFVAACFLVLVAIQLFIAESGGGTIINEILTNRPVIWGYYIDKVSESYYFGLGLITTEHTSAVAEVYSEYVDRGAGSGYGTQSMFIKYLFESGVVGLFISVMVTVMVLFKRSEFFPFVVIYVIVSFFETLMIGLPSVYGLPLTVFLILALSGRKIISDIRLIR